MQAADPLAPGPRPSTAGPRGRRRARPARRRARPTSPGPTSRPERPSSTSSGMPMIRVVRTGRPSGHRLHEHDRDALGEARQAEDVGRGVEVADPVLADGAREGHAVFEPAPGDLRLQRRAVRAVADERQPHVGAAVAQHGRARRRGCPAPCRARAGRRTAPPSAPRRGRRGRRRRSASRSMPQRTMRSLSQCSGSTSFISCERRSRRCRRRRPPSRTFSASAVARHVVELGRPVHREAPRPARRRPGGR